METFFYYTAKEGAKHPVVLDETGNYAFYINGKPQRKFTDNFLRSLGKNREKVLNKRLTEVNVGSLEELLNYLSTYNELEYKLSIAENEVRRCKQALKNFLNPKKTYLETREMGCTDMVCWNNEFVVNPKTGNEFFTPEDAKTTFQNLMDENAEEIEEMRKEYNEDDNIMDFDEFFQTDHYINDNAPQLDDLIYDEENHPEWFQ